MNRLPCFLFLIAITLCSGSPAGALNINIDGNLDDWGVDPFYHWTPSRASTNWVELDNQKGPNVPQLSEENWDLEAMYFDNDENSVYFAIVASNPANYYVDTDLAFDFDGDGDFDYAVDFGEFDQKNQNVNRPVQSVTRWSTRFGGEWNLPLWVEEGETIGQANVFQRDLGNYEPGVSYKQTYVIEGSFDLSLLGLITLCNLPVEMVYTKVSCLRDSIVLSGTCHGDCGDPIPEPTSIFLLGAGLLGLGNLARRRR